MQGIQVALGEGTLAGFLLAVARTAGFVLTSPPFTTKAVPGRIRATVAMALAIPLTTWTAPVAPPLDSPELLLQAVLCVLTGVALGFLVLLATATLQVVGELVDLVGGFTMTAALDPLTLMQTSVMGRLHQLLAVTLLMASDGHLMVIHGLSRSVQLMPLPSLSVEDLARTVAHDVAALMAAAVQVAGPVIAVMIIADVALGLLTRAAPALNAFALSFPLKLLLTLLLVGLVVVQLPGVLEQRVEQAVLDILRLSGGG